MTRLIPKIAKQHSGLDLVFVGDGLKNLYSVIKDSDAYVKFCLLTGVSKFSKVSLFSRLTYLFEFKVKGHSGDDKQALKQLLNQHQKARNLVNSTRTSACRISESQETQGYRAMLA